MQSGVGDRLMAKRSGSGEPDFRNVEALGGRSIVNSELYFVKSRTHRVDAIDTRRFAANKVTLIYLSFTNVRISIVLPGGGASVEGGVTGTRSRKERLRREFGA